MQATTDNELIDAYHETLSSYRVATAGQRTEALVQFAAAEVALISRFRVDNYHEHYDMRHAS